MPLVILGLFVVGYAAIVLERVIKIDKAAVALLMGVLCWTGYAAAAPARGVVEQQLLKHLGDTAGVLFFLMGAMTVVALIDVHDGFSVVARFISATSRRKLLWISDLVTFFLSAVFDNLTTTIVMITLLAKLLVDKEDRMLFIGMVVIAANAGGAWSPIGDVTTTMLWIGGQVTSGNVVVELFLPSLLCAAGPLTIATFMVKGRVAPVVVQHVSPRRPLERYTALFLGLAALAFVPVFKTVTHLPPFMGMLLSLGILWVVTEMLQRKREDLFRESGAIAQALCRIDMRSVLFFLGILLSVAALEASGQLRLAATWLQQTVGNSDIIAVAIGLLSAVVDNVPLVAGAIGMYDLSTFPPDHRFWLFLCLTAGTGGSVLIIGSAAGVVAMGIGKIDFFWYLRRITPLALVGYALGCLSFVVLHG